jgi:hypothetical protein
MTEWQVFNDNLINKKVETDVIAFVSLNDYCAHNNL